MTIEEFEEEITSAIKMFRKNMENLKVDNLYGPKWFEMFGRWLDVGTEEEEESWRE